METSPECSCLKSLYDSLRSYSEGSDDRIDVEEIRRYSAHSALFDLNSDCTEQETLLLKLATILRLLKLPVLKSICEEVESQLLHSLTDMIITDSADKQPYVSYAAQKCFALFLVTFPKACDDHHIKKLLSLERFPSNVELLLQLFCLQKKMLQHDADNHRLLVNIVLEFSEKFQVWMQQQPDPEDEKQDLINGTLFKLLKKMWKYVNTKEVKETDFFHKATVCHKIIIIEIGKLYEMLTVLKVGSYALNMLLSLYNKVLKQYHEEYTITPLILILISQLSVYLQKCDLFDLSVVEEDITSSGFFGAIPSGKRLEVTKRATLLLLQVCSLQVKNGDDRWSSLLVCLSEKENEVLPSRLISLYQDDDEKLVDSLLYFLDIYISGVKLSEADHIEMMQPHQFFLRFIASIKHDHSILLDLLISPETQCLLYLTKYLKLLPTEWNSFIKECNKVDYVEVTDKENEEGRISTFNNETHQLELVSYGIDSESDCSSQEQENDPDESSDSADELKQVLERLKSETIEKKEQHIDRVMSVLIKLRLAFEKLETSNLLVYNPKPIIKLLETIEYLYEMPVDVNSDDG